MKNLNKNFFSSICKVIILLLFVFSNSLLAHDNGYSGFEIVNNGKLIVAASEDKLDNEDLSYPSVIEIPSWVTKKADPSAKYYMYYAEHHGYHIRMKWAPTIEGPWTEYNPAPNQTNTVGNSDGVMDFKSDSYRNKKHPDASPTAEDWCNGKGHIAAGDVLVDEENQVFVMSFHGKIDERQKERTCSYGSTNFGFSHSKGYVAFSPNGLNFNDPVSGGGVSGTWGNPARSFGPLEREFEGSSDGVTAQVFPNEYSRLIKVRGAWYTVGTGGEINKPINVEDPWMYKSATDRYRACWTMRGGFGATSMIETFFSSAEFANHPDNPVPGKDITDVGAKVNHIEVANLGDSIIEAYIYIRKDKSDVFDMLMRVELDVASDNWDDWTLKTANGKIILDVPCTPQAVKKAVENANGGDVDGKYYADPVSIGTPGIITVNEQKYAFIGFSSYDVNRSFNHAEGQIAAIKLFTGTPPPADYYLNVWFGGPDGNRMAGENVIITAFAAPEGEVFDKWDVEKGNPVIANINSASTTLTMPASDVTVRALYKPIVSETYYLNAWNGGPDGDREPGEKVTINAHAAPLGEEFDKWIIELGNPVISDINSPSIIVTMPAEDVTIRATYKPISSWVEIAFDNFNDGYGSWIDGGANCRRTTLKNPIEGTHSLMLFDNLASSLSTTTNLALSGYNSIKVEFDFKSVDMENGDNFSLQISPNGNGVFVTVATYEKGVGNWVNNNQVISIEEIFSGYSLTNNTQLRLRCNANTLSDVVLFDNVRISANSAVLKSGANESINLVELEPFISAYPNPATDMVMISTGTESGLISLYDVTGKLVMQKEFNQSNTNLDVSSLKAGMYILMAGNRTQKLMIK